MRFSKDFKHKNYFTQREILSDKAAIFFVIEESLLLFLIALQLYSFLGIELTKGKIAFFQYEPLLQNYIWFIGSIAFFIIGYLVIALRDRKVWLIHHNFSRLLFGTIKLKLTLTTLQIFIFVFAEFVFSILIALSIFVYLDPEINLVPYPYNYLSFVFLILLTFVLFSHSKKFRTSVYGPTPLQKRIHLGKHEVKRVTHTKSGYLRFKAKKN